MTESIEPSGVGASPASSETVQHLAPPPPKPVKNVHDWLRDLRMSADVNQTTVGVASDRVTPELMLATANKLLGISRREVEPDPKDSLQFQRVYGPNEYFSEHILRDAGRLGRQLLWKATNRGNLDFMQTAALDGHVSDVFNSSRLANMIDGSSPLETVDAAFKVTRIGEGGVGDVSSAPDEMRLVQPSFLGYVDSVRSPESLKVGLDTYLTKYCMKGSDGKLYQKFINARTGKPELVDSVTAAKSVVTTPDMMKAKTNYIYALGGKTGVRIVPRKDVDYYLPKMDQAFSTAANLVTGLSGVKEMRLLMGCLHPLATLVTIGKDNMVAIGYAKDVSSDSGSVPGTDNGAMTVCRHQIRATLAKFPPGRAWFRKIVLYSGRALTTSKDHRWAVLRDGKVELVDAVKLKPGDKIFRRMFDDYQGRRTFVLGVQVDSALAELLGYMTRNGSMPAKDTVRVPYAPKHRMDIENALCRLRLRTVTYHGSKAEPVLSIHDRAFAEWFAANIGQSADVRRVPSVVLSAKPTIVASFLDAYTSDDTKVAQDSQDYTWILDIGNFVERDGIAFLLSRLGTDTYYRDAYQGGGETQLALKLTEGTAKHGALLLDAVKANLPVQGAAIMIDVDADDNLYASASGIVTHNSKYPLQAISIEGREAPYVRNIDSETGKDIHSAIGKYLGARFAQKPGVVTAVRQNRIDVQYDDGTKGHVALYNNFPMNAKGYITNTAQVKAGDKFGKGDLLASSNYTDDKGVMATGTNLRVGWLSWKGGTYEDAVVLSESAARKLTGSVMYASSLDLDKTVTLGKRNYRSWKPGEYTKEQLSVLNDDGIVMPGTILHKGDPMVLAVRTTEPSPGTMGKRVLTDVSQVWEHDNPGKVTDVVRTRGGVKVLATVTTPVEVGDKVSGLYGNKGVCSMILPDDQMPVDKDGKPLDMILSPLGLVSRCYDDQTEFLTRDGWKLGKDVADEDLLYCYDPSDNTWRWDRQITPMHKFQYKGTMFGGRNRLVDFLVSPGHKVWTKSDYPKAPWKQTTIDDIFGKRYYIPCVASAPKTEPQATDFHLPLIQIKAKDTCTTSDDIVYNAGDWAEFLGWYLSEGNTTYDEQSREYRVNISQSAKAKPDNVRHLHELLTRMGFTYHYTVANTQFHIGGKRLAAYMKQFGKCHEKFIPDWLFQQPTYILRRFLDGLWAGDGREAFFPNSYGKVVHVRTIGLTSEHLIDQVQMLLAMCGESAQKHTAAVKHPGKDKPMWRLGVSTVGRTCRLLRDDDWYSIDNYDGMLYCPSVPSGYIMTRRNGKTICMGNCNPTQLTETLLGKIAHKTGKTELIDAFPENDIHQYVLDKLKQNQLNAEDDFYDPETGRRIQGVVNGYSYIHRLKHMAESKESARGTDAYSTDETPGGSGYVGSKRFGTLEQSAMAGHAAFDNLLDNKLIRGQSNADFWRSIRTGGIPTIPGEPLVQKKFFAHLQGSGVNVRKTPKGISVFALSNSDVEKLAGPRELKSRDTYEARTFRPIDGGLFGQDVFGQNGDQWGYIQLDEPVPNPVMEEPLARLLRMSVKDFTAAATGAAEVNGIRGPVQLKEALSKINLEQESKQAMQEFKDAPASKRDNALKRYVAVENMRRAGLSPAEYMLDRIPVLPAQFRPVTSHNGLTMVADANYLYAQLLDARDDLRDSRDLPQEYQDKARENLYRTWQELTGLYDPEDVKLRNKNVGGLLKWALGTSPKFSAFQRKVLGGSVDTVGRGAIIPNSKLTVDQIGIPIGMAFDIMAPFVERGLVKRGYTPVDAMKMVKKHDKQAEDVLREVVRTHPVEMNRAPTLHKFNIMAFEPVLVQGHAIQVHPSVCPGFGADFDGNCVDYDSKIILKISKSALDKTSFWYDIMSAAQEVPGDLKELIKGADMRVAKDTTVQAFTDDAHICIKIGDFPKHGTPVKDRNGADVYCVPSGVWVLSCDPETGEPGWQEVSAFTHETGCQTVKVTLGSRSVIVSDNESLAVFDNATGTLVKVKPSKDERRFIPVLKQNMMQFGTEWDRDTGWLIGAYLSDGWATDRMVGYAKLEKNKRDAFVSIMRRLHENFTLHEYNEMPGDHKLGYSTKVHMCSPTLAKYMAGWNLIDEAAKQAEGKRGALYKRIPDTVLYNGSEEFLWGLLSGLLDGDGSMTKNTSTKNPRYGCRFSTSSPSLRDGICNLLYFLGIRYSVTTTPPRNTSGEAYTICPSSIDILANIHKIQCVGEKERSLLAEWAEAPVQPDTTDVIPMSNAEAEALRPFVSTTDSTKDLYSILHRGTGKDLLRGARYIFMRHADLLKSEAPTLYARVMNTDTLWMQIDSVEDAGKRDVYDLKVDTTKVYVVNNGIVVWDTVNVHVPVSDNARREAMERMRPSRNLIAPSDRKIMYKPEKEYMQGLFFATRLGQSANGRVPIFRTKAEAEEAYEHDIIDVDTPIRILELEQKQ